MSFRLATNLVTLNDLEPWPLFCVILPNLVALGADYVKMVEDRPILTGYHNRNVAQIILFLETYHLWQYSQRLSKTSVLLSLRSYVVLVS